MPGGAVDYPGEEIDLHRAALIRAALQHVFSAGGELYRQVAGNASSEQLLSSRNHAGPHSFANRHYSASNDAVFKHFPPATHAIAGVPTSPSNYFLNGATSLRTVS